MSPAFEVEISDKFTGIRDCERFVYSQISGSCKLFKTRLYVIEGTGSVEELDELVEDVLADSVSQSWTINANGHGKPTVDGNFSYRLDVSLKSTVLDLEEEYVSEFLTDDDFDFSVDDLTIKDRYYVDTSQEETVEELADDIVNPVIHEWSVTDLE